MFERYMNSFFQDDDSDPVKKPVRATRKEAPEEKLPFDLELKRRILGEEAGMPLEETAMQEDAMPDEHAPEEAAETPKPTQSAIRTYNAWEGLAPLGLRMTDLAQARQKQFGDVKAATDVLRTQILQKMRAEGWTRLAITAPTSGCGTTFTTLNLAMSLAAVIDVKTVLLDLNQRSPGLAKALGLSKAPAISQMLLGEVAVQDYLLRSETNLAVGLNAGTPHNAAEILQSRGAEAALREIDTVLEPEILLCDIPPMLECDDMTAFAPLVDCVLLVADGTKTLSTQIEECAELLDGRVPLLGVVLNRGRQLRKGWRAASA